MINSRESYRETHQQPTRRNVLSIFDQTETARWFQQGTQRNLLWALTIAIVACFSFTSQAAAETRSLKLYFIHTKERAEIVYKRNGRYDQRGLNEINRFLRDWRRNEPTKMDPKLLDALWEVYRAAGGRDYIHVVSAYRSPTTNAMLRSRSSGVAKSSQHTLGKAIDFYIPGVKLSKIRAAGFKVAAGGVGYYPKSGSPFVHLDVGNVRSWPRMNRNELMALFPDGRTMHLPADGKALPGYQQALADYKSRQRTGATVQIASASDSSSSNASASGGSGGGLLSALFGGGNRAANQPEQQPSRAVAQQQPAQAPAQTVLAALPETGIPTPFAAPRQQAIATAPSAQETTIEQLVAAAPAPVEESVGPTIANVPLPSWRPEYSAPAVQEVAVATAESNLPISAIVPENNPGVATDAIAEMLAASAADARAGVVINHPPLPGARPDVNEGVDVASTGGGVFALAALPTPGGSSATRNDKVNDLIAAAESQEDSRRAASQAQPRIAVVDHGLEANSHANGKSARPRAGEIARREPKSIPMPAAPEMTRWAFKRDVNVTNAGGTAEPADAYNIVWSAPKTVYTTGFQHDADVNPNRFSGKAVTFLSVARFATN